MSRISWRFGNLVFPYVVLKSREIHIRPSIRGGLISDVTLKFGRLPIGCYNIEQKIYGRRAVDGLICANGILSVFEIRSFPNGGCNLEKSISALASWDA